MWLTQAHNRATDAGAGGFCFCQVSLWPTPAVALPARMIICEKLARRSVIADRATVRRALASLAWPPPAHLAPRLNGARLGGVEKPPPRIRSSCIVPIQSYNGTRSTSGRCPLGRNPRSIAVSAQCMLSGPHLQPARGVRSVSQLVL